jgi:hypothetical protein
MTAMLEWRTGLAKGRSRLINALHACERAAQRALGGAALAKWKMALAKKDFRRFRAANAILPKHVAPLVNLARSAPGNGEETSFMPFNREAIR